MDNIGIGLLLNLVFWVVAVSALVFLGVWAAAEVFFGTVGRLHRVRKTVRAATGKRDSPRPSPEREETGERYRKAS